MANIEINVYSDGACTMGKKYAPHNPGGWGALVMGDNGNKIVKKSGYAKNTTSIRMEMEGFMCGLKEGILMAVNEYTNDKNPDRFQNVNIYIHTDSAFIVNAINKGWYNNWKAQHWLKTDMEPISNLDLWRKYEDLLCWLDVINDIEGDRFKIHVIKVKGHSGNQYNDIVDTMAVNAKLRIISEL